MTVERRSKEIEDLVRRTLPGIRCLRCGFDEFYVATDIDALGTGQPGRRSALSLQGMDRAGRPAVAVDVPVLTLACARCGHLENHVTGILAKAQGPVVPEDGDEP